MKLEKKLCRQMERETKEMAYEPEHNGIHQSVANIKKWIKAVLMSKAFLYIVVAVLSALYFI